MKNITLTLLAAATLSLTAGARQLSPEAALGRVVIPGQKATPMTTQSLTDSEAPRLVYTATDGAVTTLYVFDRGSSQSPSGFMVVAADDVAPVALLGYADKGAFDAASPSMMWWLDSYSSQIATAAREGVNSEEVESGVNPYADLAPIEPLVTTYWNQLEPYNAMIPTDGGKHAPVGCVPVAMAQIMNYHKYPSAGTGEISYRSTAIDSTLTIDLSTVNLDWAALQPRYSAGDTGASATAMAKIMRALALSVHTQFRATASSANFTTAARAMVNNYGYDKGIRHLDRDYYDLPQWIDIIYGELAAGRPVLYGGTNNEEGHAFVCDGYSTDGYFHINWGWGGMSDGNFLLTALNPEDQGVGGCTGAYNIGQTVVVGIQPPVAGSELVPIVDFASDFSVDSLQFTRTSTGKVIFMDVRGIFNHTLAKSEMTFGVKLTAADGTESYLGAAAPRTMISGQAIRSYEIAQSDFPTGGSYEVSPAVRSESGKWFDAGVKLSNTRSYTLECTPTALNFEAVDVATISATGLRLTSPLISGEEFSVTATLHNATDEEFLETVRPVLWKDGEEVATATPMEVDLLGGDSQFAEWVSTFSGTLTPGNYQLSLIDSKGHALCRAIDVTLIEKPAGALAMSGRDAVASVESDSLKVTFDLVCTSGFYTGRLSGTIHDHEGNYIGKIESGFVGIKEGETRQVTFVHPIVALKDGETYSFMAYHDEKPLLTDAAGTATPVTFTVGMAAIGSLDGDESDIIIRLDGQHVTVTAPEPVTTLEVYAMTGIKVVSIVPPAGESSVSADLSGLISGIYVVRAATATGSETKRVALR